MKKVISSLAIAAAMTFGFVNLSSAEDVQQTVENAADAVEGTVKDAGQAVQDAVNDNASEVSEGVEKEANDSGTPDGEPSVNGEEEVKLSFIQTLKQQYIDGDAFWMSWVLVALIIGLALSIERIVYLNLSTINTSKFIRDVESALKNGGVEAAKDLCRNTRGPIASIYYQGLDRADEGIEAVEKSVVAYGGVQMGLLEKGLSWLSLFIALAPMLGFLGTVIGMIQAFDKIVSDGQVSPITVASGIKVSLLTTVFGLITAIILQIFYNYIVAKVDGIVNEMEDASITLVDMMLENNTAK